MHNLQRNIKNVFIQPQFQLKLSLYYIVIGGVGAEPARRSKPDHEQR
ncbi:MAG: hypothetical protein ACJAXW_002124 [Candidatus Azotimanducaceae bacterium]|jgi:hypothetical protein